MFNILAECKNRHKLSDLGLHYLLRLGSDLVVAVRQIQWKMLDFHVIQINSLTTKKQMTKFPSANFLKMLSSSYDIENSKTKEQTV